MHMGAFNIPKGMWKTILDIGVDWCNTTQRGSHKGYKGVQPGVVYLFFCMYSS